MKKYILTVTLNPAIDRTVKVPGFRVGQDFRAQEVSLSAGGKGINVSRVLKRLGQPTLATGFLGGFSSRYMRRQLEREKIAADFSAVGGNTRISLTILDPGQNTITRVLEQGPPVTRREVAEFKKKFRRRLDRASFVVFSGRNIYGAAPSIYAQLIRQARRQGVKALLDTSGPALQEGVRAKPFMIKPNWQETEQLLGKKIPTLAGLKAALPYLHSFGVEVVAITFGSRGVICSNGQEVWQAVPPRIKRKSPVGCGDAFVAGFVFSLLGKQSFPACLRLAVACGAANAATINPGYIKKAFLKKMLAQVKIRSL